MRWRRAVLGLTVAAVGGLGGCGGEGRSVSAYCDYFFDQGAELRERYVGLRADFDTDPLTAMAQALAGPTELGMFLAELAKRAPDDIAPDVEIMAETMGGATDRAASGAGEPVSAMGGGLLSALASAPAVDRVDRYTREHCGPPPS